MTGYPPEDRGAAFALALLRLTLLMVIFVSEQLIDARQLADSQFFVALGIAAGYSLAGILVPLRGADRTGARAFIRAQPALDVVLLAALTYTSGGAFSDVRKAFFVIPLAAAFSERSRSTAKWSLVAVATFSFQAAAAGGHPAGAQNGWQELTLNQDLYLAWTGAAATMLALALRRRSAQTEELARSRQRLLAHAIESVERERTRLASALHDSPVQNLIAARHDLRRAERSGDSESFRRLHDAIDATIAQLREEIFNLHPHVLDHVGLRAALEQVARRQAVESDLRVVVEVNGDVGSGPQEVLFALGRELLLNAGKHAHATEVRLSVEREAESVELLVVDNGCGIPEGRLRQAVLDGHVGLAAVSERVATLGGSLSVATAPGAGTTVRITLPLTRVDVQPREDTLDLRSSRVWISDRVTPGDSLRLSPSGP